ncbi:hypothetical protein H6P81_020534 [Aristolochia fimbriata]|uniref:Uncharacterized protein n=1 Tax=Aristolochia fimbriata TaxID=158543 RepID=A0AAV7DVT4_ARIFI|nr:hypothetical protein H6P81_020534 [Aristolochia fimbriata]
MAGTGRFSASELRRLLLLVLVGFLVSLPSDRVLVRARPMNHFVSELTTLADESSTAGSSLSDGCEGGGLLLGGAGVAYVDTLRAIKNPGPSPRGDGHNFTTVDTLGGIDEAGQSPKGPGH